MSLTPIIEIKNLSLDLGGRAVLRDISLSVPAGEYISIVGCNGAGKSSFLKALGGIHRHWSGTIQIGNHDVRKYQRKEFARVMSYVPQSQNPSIPYSVEEFISLSRYPYLSPFSRPDTRDRAAIKRALQFTEMEHLRERQIKTLSGGERQMVFIAAALAQDTDILIIDEPTTFLDYSHANSVMETLHRINKTRELTILAVTHEINSAARWSDRILALKNGRLLFLDSPLKIMNPKRLKSIYKTSFHILKRGDGKTPLAICGAGKSFMKNCENGKGI